MAAPVLRAAFLAFSQTAPASSCAETALDWRASARRGKWLARWRIQWLGLLVRLAPLPASPGSAAAAVRSHWQHVAATECSQAASGDPATVDHRGRPGEDRRRATAEGEAASGW